MAFDLDGTLINSKEEIFAGVIEGLEILRAKGLRLVIVTGRTPIEFKKLSLPDSFISLFQNKVICNDGNTEYDITTGKTCGLHTFEEAFLYKILPFVKLWGSFVLEKNGKLYASNREALLKISMLFQISRASVELYNENLIIPIHVTHIYIFPKDNQSKAELFRINIPNVGIRESEFFEMVKLFPKNSCKARGLKIVLQCQGITLDEVIAFGDGENDISLFIACKLGVAVQQSVESLIRIADFHLNTSLGEFLRSGN